jgi:hypothetical protein
MTSNNTEQRLRVTYTHDDEFIIPHGIDLNDESQVISHAVKWNILHIKLKNGTTLEIEAQGHIHDYDYKYPDNEEIVDEEIEPTDFTENTRDFCDKCKEKESGAWSATRDGLDYNFCEDCMIEWDKIPEKKKPSLQEWTEPEVTISHTEYCCRYGDDINKNMSEESIKNLDPPPVKINGEWVCFACADELYEWELIPESEEDPIPPYDGDGYDTKCFYCNATGCDAWMTKGEDKHPVHQDCF